MANGVVITKDTFDGMDIDSKLNVLFDLSQDTHKQICALNARKRWDKALSIIGGVFGGFIAVVAKWSFWR